jgi:hypothetical protein
MITIIVFAFVFAGELTTLFRLESVLTERFRMINLVFSQDIGKVKRYLQLLDSVSFNSMMFQFWVWPVSKLWPRELQELT